MYLDIDIILQLPEENYCEVIIIAGVSRYVPERPQPHCLAPGTALYADDGDCAECDYTLHGFMRFIPDKKNPQGFMIDLTDEQIRKIVNYYNCEEQIFEQARKYYFDSIEAN